jgi:branched-chain amino acid aminotransferase
MQNAVVNINGQITAAHQAQVSAFDRGYLYGDSLYEVVRSYRGRFFGLEEHLTRLKASAELCRMVLSQSLDRYRQEIDRTFDAFRKQPGMAATEAYARLIVSRGTGKIGFGLNCLTSPTLFTVIVQPLDAPGAAQFERGMRLKVVDRLRNDRRALDPAMKSGNYLNSLLAYLEAGAEDFEDALLCDSEGSLTEGTTFNLFYARRGILATPPLDVGILDGITRRVVIELARKAGIETREVRFPVARLHEADEVFITSSIREVFPVSRVDRVEFKTPGPITRTLAEAFRKHVDAWAASERPRAEGRPAGAPHPQP